LDLLEQDLNEAINKAETGGEKYKNRTHGDKDMIEQRKIQKKQGQRKIKRKNVEQQKKIMKVKSVYFLVLEIRPASIFLSSFASGGR
jgi:hypothetical protein